MANKKLFLIIGLFWLVIIIGFVSLKEFTLKTGEEVLLKTMPVDPRDLFRGDYIVLNYQISSINLDSLGTGALNFSVNDKAYVVLNKENEYGIPAGIYKNKPEESLSIKGTVKDIRNRQLTVEYGIESYFIPEGKGGEIERQLGRNLDVKISVDEFGNAAIISLVSEGKELDI